MDNFDKLNAEFADKGHFGFKYWFWLVCSYIFAVLGVAIVIYAAIPANNSYLALLSMLCGLFGWQTNAWSKAAGGARTKPLTISLVISFAVLVVSCVVLYIILPYFS